MDKVIDWRDSNPCKEDNAQARRCQPTKFLICFNFWKIRDTNDPDYNKCAKFVRYGWHFPELGKIVSDNLAFVRTVELMGVRENAKHTDMSDVLPEEVPYLIY